MNYRRFIFSISVLFIFHACTQPPVSNDLKRSTPEAEGVSSEGLIGFLNAVEKSGHELHSFMFLRHGKVIAEGWWDPYKPELKHTMYSTSKSFTSTAAGFAVSEKRIKPDDKVISFFPEYLPDSVSPYLSQLTVKHLLMMSAGQDPDPTHLVVTTDSNWIKSFLATPVIHEPGSEFLYNTLATYMVSAIVQKVTGEKIIDYMKPRLFDPLGIEGMDWEVDPMGINTGGWGLRIRTEDMARFGQLYLQKGKWKGKQLLPEFWIEEATSFKIQQSPNLPRSMRDSSDWTQGYCYQFWRSRHNSFRGDGAYGQFILVLPEQDAVIAITAETQDMQSELNLVWNHILPSMHPEELPSDEKSLSALKQKLSSLALPITSAQTESPDISSVSGKPFTLDSNDRMLENISFSFENDLCQVKLKSGMEIYDLSFGLNKWQFGETKKHGPYLLLNAKAVFSGLPPFKVAGAYSWKDENTLELVLRYIESPHTETLLCRFDQNKVSVDIIHSNRPGSTTMTLKGILQE